MLRDFLIISLFFANETQREKWKGRDRFGAIFSVSTAQWMPQKAKGSVQGG
jgi:hypothetical protein